MKLHFIFNHLPAGMGWLVVDNKRYIRACSKQLLNRPLGHSLRKYLRRQIIDYTDTVKNYYILIYKEI